MTFSEHMTPNQIIEKYIERAIVLNTQEKHFSKMIVGFIGIPGSGKTTLSKILASLLPAVHIASDDIKRMMYGTKIYDVAEFFKVQQKSILQASEYVSVISDANSDKHIYRNQLQSIASIYNSKCFFIRCIIDIETAFKRVKQRQNESSLSLDKIKKYSLELEESNDVLSLDTNHLTIQECIDKIINYISS